MCPEPSAFLILMFRFAGSEMTPLGVSFFEGSLCLCESETKGNAICWGVPLKKSHSKPKGKPQFVVGSPE